MKTPADKSQYKRLYLIQPEIYNRVLPKLNEVEKQELKDLNEKNSNFQEDEETLEEKDDNGEGVNEGTEGVNDIVEEVTDDVKMDQPPENKEEPKTDKVRLIL